MSNILSLKEKIEFVFKYLDIKKNNYGDSIKEEIYFHFENFEEDEFGFLDKLNTYDEISTKLEFIVSKIILHEHEDGLQNILNDYIS